MRRRLLAVATAAMLATGALSGCFGGGGSDDCESLPATAVVAQSLTGDVTAGKPKPKKKAKKNTHTGTGSHHDDDCDDD